MGDANRPQCGDCAFARVMGEALWCVKNAPQLDPTTGHARWPIVSQTDICGCFRSARHQATVGTAQGARRELPIYTDHPGEYCKIPLTQGRFAKVDPDDYAWLSQFRWHCHKRERTYYAVRTVWQDGVSSKVFMHRAIMDTPPDMVCDHINRAGLDNRKANLRNCTRAQNNLNRAARRDSRSPYKGVYWKKRARKWAACIQANGKQKHLGYFDDPAEAAKAYDAAATRLHGQFAALNFST